MPANPRDPKLPLPAAPVKDAGELVEALVAVEFELVTPDAVVDVPA